MLLLSNQLYLLVISYFNIESYQGNRKAVKVAQLSSSRLALIRIGAKYSEKL
jgi:hypothetical protein